VKGKRAIVLATLTACSIAVLAPSRPPAAPTLFGEGVFSTPDDEFGAAIAPGGAYAFFNRSIPRSQFYTIFRTRAEGSRWTAGEVAPFSGQWRDFDPVFGPSGRLYFISDRPRGASSQDGEYNVWYLEHPAGGTEPAKELGPPVNGSGSVHFVSETSDGTLYVCASREGGIGPSDVYRAVRGASGYAPLESLGPAVNGAEWLNLEAYVSADEKVLIVSAYGHEDALGDSDLYGSRRCGGAWQPLVNLGPDVNSAARDYSPRITPDGRTLLFASERGLPTEARPKNLTYAELIRRIRGVRNGLGNIYAMPLDAALVAVKPCPTAKPR